MKGKMLLLLSARALGALFLAMLVEQRCNVIPTRLSRDRISFHGLTQRWYGLDDVILWFLVSFTVRVRMYVPRA